MSIARSCATGAVAGAALLAFALATTSCGPVLSREFASVRLAEYLASHRELAPRVVLAIEAGHILLGMDTEQVWVVLGDPVRKTRFAKSGTEVWLYQAGRLHQNHHLLGGQPTRLVFVKDRLVVIEPL